MRVLLISMSVVLIIVMVLFGARIWGLNQSFFEFDHPFVKTSPLNAVRIGTADEARAAIARVPNLILWVDLRVTADQRILVLREKTLREFLKDKPSRKTLEELRPLFPHAPLLEDLLKEFPNQRFILNVADNVMDVDRILVKAIEPFQPDKRFLIQSDAAVILKSVKDLQPLWLFGTSWPEIMRLMSFESIWLLSAAPFNGDVFIAPLEVSGRPAFNDAVLEEMHRRKKKVLIGPLANAAEVEVAKGLKVDGFIVDEPGLLSLLP